MREIKTVDDIFTVVREQGRPLSSFQKGDTIRVSDRMQTGYSYVLEEEPGKNFHPEFKPFASPGEILALGAFGGKYMNDCLLEFPAEWFLNAALLGKLSPQGQNIDLNYFKIDSRLPLSYWKQSGWVPGGKKLTGSRSVLSDKDRNPDIRGWFQWYCRYWMGRRIPELDEVQIRRWKNFRRHSLAVEKNCPARDGTCRPRQRQALLHWAYNFLV